MGHIWQVVSSLVPEGKEEVVKNITGKQLGPDNKDLCIGGK